MVFLHGEGDKCGGILLPEIAIQLGDFLLSERFDGIVHRDLLAGESTLHRNRSFRVEESGAGELSLI